MNRGSLPHSRPLPAVVFAIAGLVLLVACTSEVKPRTPGGAMPTAVATPPAVTETVPAPPNAGTPRPTASSSAAAATPSVPLPPTPAATPGAPVTGSPIGGGPTPPTSGPPEAKLVTGLAGTGLVLERAPIEALELRIAASAPQQHFVDVTSGLPNGCARFYGYEIARAGDTITVTVWNTMPADIRAACTMLYGFAMHAVPLGANLVPGRQYTLKVNDKDTTFIAR